MAWTQRLWRTKRFFEPVKHIGSQWNTEVVCLRGDGEILSLPYNPPWTQNGWSTGGEMKKINIWSTSLLLVCMSLFYISCLHHSEPTEVGIMRNWVTGELKRDSPGWNFSPPWVSVAKIDTRPIKVCVNSAGRAFNCKLVQFESKFFKELIQTEGFRYYWWDNRISVNFGYTDEHRGVRDLLRGYAYSVEKYPFITIIQENFFVQ